MKGLAILAILLGGCASTPYWQKEQRTALETSMSCSKPLNDAVGANYQVLTLCSGGREKFVYRMPRCVTQRVYCN